MIREMDRFCEGDARPASPGMCGFSLLLSSAPLVPSRNEVLHYPLVAWDKLPLETPSLLLLTNASLLSSFDQVHSFW